MKSFEVSESTTVAQFIEKVRLSIKDRSIGEIVSLKETGNQIVVTIQKLGTSEMRFNVKSNASGGFLATFESEKIAFAHKPFRGDVEGKLAQVLESLGAKTVM